MSWSEIAESARADAAAAAGLMLVVSSAAFAQQTSNANTVGASVPGIPTQLYLKPADSTGGVTQATSANKGMQCATGQVLSGGACVPLSTLVTNTSCAYGEVFSGNSCVPLSSLTPPPTNCPTGYVLSGGNCVPLASPTPPTSPTSCGGGAFTLVWGVGCSYSNSVPVTPSGQSVFLTNTGYGYSGNATYQCNSGNWASLNQYCVQTVPPPPASCIQMTGLTTWGAGCSSSQTVPATPNSGTFTTPNTAPNWTGARSYQCNNGSWGVTSATCIAVQQPLPCRATPVNWSSCAAQVSTETAHGSYTPTLTNTVAGFTGTAQFSCNNGALSVVSGASCNQIPSPPPPPPPAAFCRDIREFGSVWLTDMPVVGGNVVNGYASGSGQEAYLYYPYTSPPDNITNHPNVCVYQATMSQGTSSTTYPEGTVLTLSDSTYPKTGSQTVRCNLITYGGRNYTLWMPYLSNPTCN